MQDTPENRLETLASIYQEYRELYRVGGGLTLILIGGLLFSVADYTTNLYTEFLGIAVTVLILNRLAERRELRHHADLNSANLLGAQLESTDLNGAILCNAVLIKSDLRHADLRRTNLRYARIKGAQLHGALLDEDTILPDGTRWSPETDMTIFGVQ